MHPLTPDVSKLTDQELAYKITDLNKRLAAGYRFGNTDIVRQAHMILEDYMEENKKRNDELIKKLQEQNKGSGDDWDEIIDIK